MTAAAFADSGQQQAPDKRPHVTLWLHFPHLYRRRSHEKCSGLLSLSGKTEENRNKEDSVFVTKLQFLKRVLLESRHPCPVAGDGNLTAPSLGEPKIPMFPAEGHLGPGDQHGGVGPFPQALTCCICSWEAGQIPTPFPSRGHN